MQPVIELSSNNSREPVTPFDKYEKHGRSQNYLSQVRIKGKFPYLLLENKDIDTPVTHRNREKYNGC